MRSEWAMELIGLWGAICICDILPEESLGYLGEVGGGDK